MNETSNLRLLRNPWRPPHMNSFLVFGVLFVGDSASVLRTLRCLFLLRESIFDDDGELNISLPTPFQICMRPPAPKPQKKAAGDQGAACGGVALNLGPVLLNISGRGVFFR